jgi:hypothetical protein
MIEQTYNALANALAPLLLTSVLVFVLLSFGKGAQWAYSRKLRGALAALIAVSILSTILLGYVVKTRYMGEFSDLATAGLTRLTITRGLQVTEVVDPAQIALFFGTIRKGAAVNSHYSKATQPLSLSFPNVTRTYRLSLDSETPDEYWLEFESGSGSTQTGMLLKQFQSKALSEWLKSTLPHEGG